MKSFSEFSQSLQESTWLGSLDDKKIYFNGDIPGTGTFKKSLERELRASGGVVNLRVLELAKKKLKATDPDHVEFLDFLDDVVGTKSKKIKPQMRRREEGFWLA